MNSISSLVGQRDAVSIRSKSLQYNYLTISDSTSSILKLVMIGVFPIVYLAVGIAIVVKRRRANERTKKLYILLGVLVVICIATFALSKTEKKKENIKNSDKTEFWMWTVIL